MPGRDGTGPIGMGSGSGRGMGYCAGAYGVGYGRGYFCRRGYGMGYAVAPYEPVSRKDFLEGEKDALQSRLDLINKQIENIRE